MGFNGKHLSLEDIKIIEENVNKGLRKFETAKELNKSQSTIGKEIKNNRKRRYSQAEDSPWKCKHYKDCKVCIGRCSDFEEVPCFRRDRFIGACNGCQEIKSCKKIDLMFSHINSVPRKSLGGKTPYEAFEFFYGKDTLDKLNIQKIKEDEVTLQPYLLNL